MNVEMYEPHQTGVYLKSSRELPKALESFLQSKCTIIKQYSLTHYGLCY